MSRRQGARTGLTRRRETERELRAEAWRQKGGALNSGVTRDAAHAAAERRALEAISERALPEPTPVNHLLHMLGMAAGVLDDPVLDAAVKRLKELGLDGPDYQAKIEAMAPPFPDYAIEAIVRKHMSQGISQRAAIERTVMDLSLPSASFEGACQDVKRAIGRARFHRNSRPENATDFEPMSETEFRALADELGVDRTGLDGLFVDRKTAKPS